MAHGKWSESWYITYSRSLQIVICGIQFMCIVDAFPLPESYIKYVIMHWETITLFYYNIWIIGY